MRLTREKSLKLFPPHDLKLFGLLLKEVYKRDSPVDGPYLVTLIHLGSSKRGPT